MKISTITALALTCLVWPLAAFAQLSAPAEPAELVYGPVSLYPSLRVVDAGRDSNVFNDTTDPKSDTTFTLASRALLVTRLGSNQLLASAGTDYVWFQRYASERSNNGTYATRFNLSASRFKPFIGMERTRSRARPSAEIDARARGVTARFLTGTDFSLTERTAIVASAQLSRTEYDDGELFRGVDLAHQLNQTNRSYSGGAKYAVTPMTTVRVEATYGEDRFSGNSLRNSKTYAVTPTVEFASDAIITGTASVGMEVFKPADPLLKSYRGPTYDASLSWTCFDRTTFDVRGTRRVGYSYLVSEPYYLLTRASFTVSQRLVGPVSLTAGADRDFLSYPTQELAPDAEGEPASSGGRGVSDTLRAGVSFALSRGFTIGLTAEHARRTSNVVSGVDYTRTRVLSTLTVGY